MAYNTSRRVSFGAMLGALFQALQWRLLLLWLLLMLIPAIVVALPLARSLGDLLNHSVHSERWASGFDALMFGDTVRFLSDSSGALGGAFFAALAITILLSPLLNGMIVGSGRAGRALGFGHLLQSGVVEYGRMFRLMIGSLVPYAIAGGVFAAISHVIDDKADAAVLESQVTAVRHGLLWVIALAIVLAQVIVESGRAAYIADPQLRSATVALWRGLKQLVRRPLSSLVGYVLVTVIGFGIAFALGVARANTTATGAHLLVALVLSQLVVVSIGWTRIARLFTLAEVARSLGYASRRAGLSSY